MPKLLDIHLPSLLMWGAIAIGSAPASFAAAPPPKETKINFDREIRSILSDNCFACHGPDEKQRMAGLHFDTKEGAFAKPGVIVPGKVDESKLIQRISASNKARRMPPPSSGRTLTDAQIELLKKWVEQGANWETHWAYTPPKAVAPPEVSNKAWVRNPIDNFILARLDREKLNPSPPADRTTLLRRVTFDLTGLPPTPAQIDAFLKDKSPDAYEKRVDELLNSPAYGERMAMQWLDIARYADTHGYHIDSHREMWHWRDWVINAFNRNMPFDQFAVEQLAGDLLPNATLDQKIASGFNRNHMINFEGGAIPEEYQNEYVVDRVETTAVAFMGMTMGCARCHDHKYDPIKQKEFYQFYAFFNSIPEKGLDGRKGNAAPLLPLPSDDQKQRLESVKTEIASIKKALPETRVSELEKAWGAAASLPSPSREGLLAHYEFEGGFGDSSGHYHAGRILTSDLTYSPGPVGRGADFDGETHVDLGDLAGFEKSDPFSIAVWVRSGDREEMPILQRTGLADASRGWQLLVNEAPPIGHLMRGAPFSFRLIHRWPEDSIEVRTKKFFPTSSKLEGALPPWYQVTVVYDGSGHASGIKLYVNGKLEDVDVRHDKLTGSIRTPAPLEIGNKKLGTAYKGKLDDLRIYNRQLTPAEIEQLAIHEPARATLFLAEAKRAKDHKTRLREYFLTYAAPPADRELYARLKTLEIQQFDLEDQIPTSMIMAEMEKPRETAILGRGDYRNRGEKVTPGVPAILPPLPKDAPANRLTLARWLVSPTHPLTSRVAVNRFWQMYFGAGIVKTAEDLGSQGEAPVHPELLDWLATTFIGSGWDVKAMQRLIVTSATYRQSSKFNPLLIERDPENRLLARGPRFRLPAEMVRDNALTVSGLIDRRIGGASVFPYQPPGLWEDIAFGDVYSAQSYSPSHGKDLYRRSMYSFWKRTSPPPSLATFDAPDREKCTARRTLTNTPLQALVLLNDPTYVEAARALAQRMLAEGGADTSKRIAYGFRAATGRAPSANEMKILRELLTKERPEFQRAPDAAAKLVAVGESEASPRIEKPELAAWTTVAGVILNLDETITKE